MSDTEHQARRLRVLRLGLGLLIGLAVLLALPAVVRLAAPVVPAGAFLATQRWPLEWAAQDVLKREGANAGGDRAVDVALPPQFAYLSTAGRVAYLQKGQHRWVFFGMDNGADFPMASGLYYSAEPDSPPAVEDNYSRLSDRWWEGGFNTGYLEGGSLD
jgi:hypothetical protein